MFTKGQLVTMLQSWDDKGTVSIRRLVVRSCGAKRMVLQEENGEICQGAAFRPSIEQWGFAFVLPRMEDEQAEAAALLRDFFARRR